MSGWNIERGTVEGIDALIAESNRMRVEILPSCGAKIRSIFDRKYQKEWLWKNPYMELKEPNGSSDYVGKFDNGGWDECFPTIAPCKIKLESGQTEEFGDHGEIWSRAWTNESIKEKDGETILTLSTLHPSLPVSIERSLIFKSENQVTAQYQIQNQSEDSIPYLYAIHPLIALESGLKLGLPKTSKIEISAGVNHDEYKKHFLKNISNDGLVDLLPKNVTNVAMKAFISGLNDHPIRLEDTSGSHFSFQFSDQDFDGIGLWINAGHWSGCGSDHYWNIGFEPVVGLADNLEEAIKNNQKTGVLEGHQTQVRNVTFSLNH